jgi:hypothetical protein
LYENLSAKSAKSRIGPVELQIGDRVILLTSGDNSTAGTVVENGPKGKVRVRFDDLSTVLWTLRVASLQRVEAAKPKEEVLP